MASDHLTFSFSLTESPRVRNPECLFFYKETHVDTDIRKERRKERTRNMERKEGKKRERKDRRAGRPRYFIHRRLKQRQVVAKSLCSLVSFDFVALGIEPRASDLLGNCSVTKLHIQH